MPHANRTRALLVSLTVAIVVAAATLFATAAPTRACGGFFCGISPVDQSAERIIFAVHSNNTVTMAVQIAYQGTAEEFAWILPLPKVPDPDSLATLPIEAFTGLDAATGPQFIQPEECWDYREFAPSAGGGDDSGQDAGVENDGDVDVYIQKKVGGYIAAVVGSDDPSALVTWLRDNGFRVTDPQIPYIKQYTDEGMKFLALKLADESDVSDIAPLQFTLEGSAPSIPLRMTALAAEPEMGVAVFVFADQRFGGANWPDVAIDDDKIVWELNTWPMKTNWSALVAQGVDAAGGTGWVTELAEPIGPYRELLQNSFVQDEAQEKARDALLSLMAGSTYVSRLYSRLSAEEMGSDPILKRVAGADVGRTHMLSRYVDGRDLCPDSGTDPFGASGASEPVTTPCDFVSCGAAGLCRNVESGGGLLAGCACLIGASARTVAGPLGVQTVCQDQRMSFLNPGDRETEDASPLPDPCVGFDCGDGECVPVNMTPTCVCRTGLVAVGAVGEGGARSTTCSTPTAAVPASFYEKKLPDLANNPGREEIVRPRGASLLAGGGGCSVGASAPAGALAVLFGLAVLAFRRRRA